MPIISTFFGILIRMYFDDHAPPHFHAEHHGREAVIDFEGRILAGEMGSATARWLHGEVFQSLTNRREFKRFFVSGGTVCWPNGADVAPETLRAAEDAATNAA
ncbi:MAG: hypothetical protein JWN02_1200 [Acidobacteria bacterium]|nr:hypothetical protein [Acidobacteriota bacterium]